MSDKDADINQLEHHDPAGSADGKNGSGVHSDADILAIPSAPAVGESGPGAATDNEIPGSGRVDSHPARQPRDAAPVYDEAFLPGRSKGPFQPDRIDAVLALAAFILGFFFVRWVLAGGWQGWGVGLFTLMYCSAVTVYLLQRGVKIPREGWFWLAVVVLTGLSYALWADIGLEPWRSLLLFGSAVYWIIMATGLPILGRTSSLFWLDGINALWVIPFRNFGGQYKSLAYLSQRRKAGWSQAASIVLGVILALIVASVVLPLLMEADSGGFALLADGLANWLENISAEVWELIFEIILAIPVAAYMFGLIAGSAHQRGADSFSRDGVLRAVTGLQIVPAATIYTLLGLLGALYTVFIASQLPYFFSAFGGELPGTWQVYSEYARRGFFELCSIAAINLMVLTAANVFSRRQYRESTPLKLLNALLAVITLILIATAFSKMSLYIGAYGMTMPRLLPCFFMIFMVIVFGAVVARQRWSFSISRLAVLVGVAMLCLLCVLDPDRMVTRYNADRYMAGTLVSFDPTILYRSGPAGVDAALQVYGQTDDLALRSELRQYLQLQQENVENRRGTSRDNLQTARARQDIAAVLGPLLDPPDRGEASG